MGVVFAVIRTTSMSCSSARSLVTLHRFLLRDNPHELSALLFDESYRNRIWNFIVTWVVFLFDQRADFLAVDSLGKCHQISCYLLK